MDVATSTVQTLVNTSFAQGAQEARRDSLSQPTIPQLNQSALSQQNAALSSGASNANPASSSLFQQTDALLKNSIEDKRFEATEEKIAITNQGKEDLKKDNEQNNSTSGDQEGSQGNPNDKKDFMYTLGASFKELTDSDSHYAQVIAEKYNQAIPKRNLGTAINLNC